MMKSITKDRPQKTIGDMMFEARMSNHYHEEKISFYYKVLGVSVFIGSICIVGLTVTSIFYFESIFVDVFSIVCGFLALTAKNKLFDPEISRKIVRHNELRTKWVDFLSHCDSTPRDELVHDFYNINSQEPPPDRRQLDRSYHAACRMTHGKDCSFSESVH